MTEKSIQAPTHGNNIEITESKVSKKYLTNRKQLKVQGRTLQRLLGKYKEIKDKIIKKKIK